MAVDVFISFARPDEGFVRQLDALLSSRGISVWWDKQLRQSGDGGYHGEISNALREARIVLVLLSKASAGSEWVRREVEFGAGRLLPVRVDEVDKSLWPEECKLFSVLDVYPEPLHGTLGPSVMDLLAAIERKLQGSSEGRAVARPSGAAETDATGDQAGQVIIQNNSGNFINNAQGPITFDQRKN